MRKGILYVVSAPSGTGKTTVCREAMRKLNNVHFTVSFTTREKRPAEEEGREYHFVTPEKFQRMVEAGEFAEYANVYGNFYGTAYAEFEAHQAAGRDLIVEIDVQGARTLKDRFAEAVLIFIHPPSLGALRERLEGRGTDKPEVIDHRLSIASRELAQMSWYHYLVENAELDCAVTDFCAIVTAERRRRERVIAEIANRFPGILNP
jgi:guanylate kinase